MVRLVFAAFLAFFLAQESSLGSIFAGEECSESCPEDSPAGRCSPVCATCACGTRLNPVPPRGVRLAEPPVRDAFELEVPAVAPAEEHPSDIAHVPIDLPA